MVGFAKGKMNKNGWLRVAEASIAIIIIISVVLIIVSNRQPTKNQDFNTFLTIQLDEIAKNNSLRTLITEYDVEKEESEGRNGEIITSLNSFLESKIEQSFLTYKIKICSATENCFLNEYPSNAKNIYSAERIISTTIESPSYSPKKVKLFLWIEE